LGFGFSGFGSTYTRDVEAHLDACEACFAELVDLEDAVVELARAAPPRMPSRDVTGRILDVPSRPVMRERRRRTWPLRTLMGGAVAAVLAVLVVSQVSLRRRLDRATGMLAQGRQLLDFMSSPDVVTIALAPTASAPDARALVSFDRRSRRVVVVSHDLPPPPAGEVYQLWLIADGVRPGDPVGRPTRRYGDAGERLIWVPRRATLRHHARAGPGSAGSHGRHRAPGRTVPAAARAVSAPAGDQRSRTMMARSSALILSRMRDPLPT
jgi:hypothetical protein